MKDQLLNEVKNKRSKKLIRLSDDMAEAYLQKYIGKEVEVLYEREVETGVYEGHTTNYIKVHGTTEQPVENRILKTKIISVEHEIAFGQVQ